MSVATVQPPYEPPAGQSDLARWVSIAGAAANLADRIAATEFVPEAMRDNPAMVTAAIMYGDELGVGPMQALAGINVIRGKPTPSSELMRALVFRAGHTLRVLASDGKTCRVLGQRREDKEPTVIEWSLDMARAAGLLDGDRGATWRRYPRAMLLARATSELCRVMFPDVVKGLGHIMDDDGTAEGFDSWAASETKTAPEPPKATGTVTRKTARTRGVQTTELPPPPRPDDDPPHALAEPERDDGWPDGVDQPPLPLEPPAGNVETRGSGGTPRNETSPPVSSPPDLAPPAEPLPPDDADAVRDDTAPPGGRLVATIHTLFGELGIGEAERGLKLAIASRAIGRTVESTKHLTRHEGLTLIRVLNDMHVGLLTFGVNPDGTVDIYAREDTDQ